MPPDPQHAADAVPISASASTAHMKRCFIKVTYA
jgi:hypothetical protein